MALINSISNDIFDRLKRVNPFHFGEAWKNFPKAQGTAELSTAGGEEAITISGLTATDHANVSIITDDTGTAITSLSAVCTADTLTITRTDDGSSADDAVVSYVVFKG